MLYSKRAPNQRRLGIKQEVGGRREGEGEARVGDRSALFKTSFQPEEGWEKNITSRGRFRNINYRTMLH